VKLKTQDAGGGRGLWVADFVDQYGKACSIQDSSLATEACIWLGRNENEEPHYYGRPRMPRMHLTQKQVAALLPLLEHFVQHGQLPRHAPKRPRKRKAR